MLSKIDRFGVRAILGRDTLYAGELRAMIFAENIRDAYRNRARAKSWVDWVEKNQYMAKILADIEKEA